jgi:hypothetical protein
MVLVGGAGCLTGTSFFIAGGSLWATVRKNLLEFSPFELLHNVIVTRMKLAFIGMSCLLDFVTTASSEVTGIQLELLFARAALSSVGHSLARLPLPCAQPQEACYPKHAVIR